MIDDDGYRPNVGIVICNRQGQVMWARRFGQHSWQFPQGGINAGETAEQAMYRELFEEVSYWYPVRQVVSFKRDVYRRVMKEFASVVMALQESTPKPQSAPAYRRKRG